MTSPSQRPASSSSEPVSGVPACALEVWSLAPELVEQDVGWSGHPRGVDVGRAGGKRGRRVRRLDVNELKGG